MSKILLIGGAGLMGSGTVLDLLRTSEHELIVADSSQERLDRLPRHDRLASVVLDVSDPPSLARALEDCDLCVNGVPTFAGYQMTIFDACLAAGKTYVDYGGMGVYTVQQKALHEHFLKAKVMAVIGLGADPGLSNVLCRACADRLDRIDTINLYWTATRVGPANPVLITPYALSTVLAEYANPSQQFLEGALREVAAQEGIEEIDLPQPWGRTTFMFSQHSEPLTVPFAKGIAEKGIREFTWRLALPKEDHECWKALVRAGFGDFDTPVTVPGGTVKPLDVLQAVMDRHRERRRPDIPTQDTHEIHFAIGVGEKDGKPTRVTARVTGHPNELYDDYADAATSMNLSIGVQLLLEKKPVPGVWAPEEIFEPADFLEEVRKRRFEVSIETVSLEGF